MIKLAQRKKTVFLFWPFLFSQIICPEAFVPMRFFVRFASNYSFLLLAATSMSMRVARGDDKIGNLPFPVFGLTIREICGIPFQIRDTAALQRAERVLKGDHWFGMSCYNCTGYLKIKIGCDCDTKCQGYSVVCSRNDVSCGAVCCHCGKVSVRY